MLFSISVGEYEGLPFFSLKLIEGRSLSQRSLTFVELAQLLGLAWPMPFTMPTNAELFMGLEAVEYPVGRKGPASCGRFRTGQQIEGGESLSQSNIGVRHAGLHGTRASARPDQATHHCRRCVWIGGFCYGFLDRSAPVQGR